MDYFVGTDFGAQTQLEVLDSVFHDIHCISGDSYVQSASSLN